MASAYVDGLQSAGVAATIKHFVGNDQEHMRTLADSVMSERALREIYLYPYALAADPGAFVTHVCPRFMLAQKNAQPWSYMTAYDARAACRCSHADAYYWLPATDEQAACIALRINISCSQSSGTNGSSTG
jgi:beta-glucosidase